MRLKFEDGIVREVEGLDINVWNADLSGDKGLHGVMITAYAMYKDAEGFWNTDTFLKVFSIETDLDPEVWGEDEWFGLSEDTGPADFPADVRKIVDNVLKEITV